jgi:hypothetical protein
VTTYAIEPDEVEETLERLHHEELLAVLNSERKTVIVARLAWADLYRAAYGDDVSGTGKPGAVNARVLSDSKPHIPTWLLHKRARPLVLVVERTEYQVQITPWTQQTWYRERLSCGHVVNVPAGFLEERPAKRRRCIECARVQYPDALNGAGIYEQPKSSVPRPVRTSAGASKNGRRARA